jgi:hypothetical protein
MAYLTAQMAQKAVLSGLSDEWKNSEQIYKDSAHHEMTYGTFVDYLRLTWKKGLIQRAHTFSRNVFYRKLPCSRKGELRAYQNQQKRYHGKHKHSRKSEMNLV